MISRRKALTGLGLAAVFVGGGIFYRAVSTGVFSADEGPAFDAWRDWRGDSEADPRMRLLHAAVLAASAHNTQPWLFRVEDDVIEVYADPARHLGAADPFRREMFMSVGCCIENLTLAAAANGFRSDVLIMEGRLDATPTFDGPELVARVYLYPTKTFPVPFYEAVPNRRTNRGPYLPDRPLMPSETMTIERMNASKDFVNTTLFIPSLARERIGEIIVAATEKIVADDEMLAVSAPWERHTRSEIRDRKDGMTYDMYGLSPEMTAVAKILPAPSPREAGKYWLEATRDTEVPTAAAFGLIGVEDPFDRRQIVTLGIIWQRTHLYATTRDIAVQPMNQPIIMMEREMATGAGGEIGDEIGRLTRRGYRPAFLFRTGYAAGPAGLSPRRPATDALLPS